MLRRRQLSLTMCQRRKMVELSPIRKYIVFDRPFQSAWHTVQVTLKVISRSSDRREVWITSVVKLCNPTRVARHLRTFPNVVLDETAVCSSLLNVLSVFPLQRKKANFTSLPITIEAVDINVRTNSEFRIFPQQDRILLVENIKRRSLAIQTSWMWNYFRICRS